MQWQINDDIVISGISGRFPECDNIDELKEKLYNHVDMITTDERRWPLDFYGLPNRLGKIKDLSKFDAHFFGSPPKLVQLSDPQARLLLELTYEAIVDAGINPQTLRGSKTGVYIGTCFAEVEEANLHDIDKASVYSLVGTAKSMLANRLSFTFDFNGPSYSIDSACSSSLLAMQHAILGIRTNQCEQAIVAGANICLRPSTSFQFMNAGMISSDGNCKHMDIEANGYARSETVSVIFLQKKPDAKRIYATVIHAKTNTDGNKDFMTFPSWTAQRNIMLETITEAVIEPEKVEYVEAHGTGTAAGDPVETKAIVDVFCKNRKEPLLIGSVKSNLGHSEPASGMNSIAKVLLSFENKLIPANINFKTPNSNIPELINGSVKLVVENTPYNGGVVALNSFGVGGVNVSVLLKPLDQELNPKYESISKDGVPRIIPATGRTEEAVKYIFDFVEKNPDKVNCEFLSLLQDISQTDLNSGMNYRGFLLAERHPDLKQAFPREISHVSPEIRPLWFVYSGMGSQWTSMAKSMMPFDVFRESIHKSAKILKPYNIDLLELLLSEKENVLETTVGPFVAITATQIALQDVLNKVGLSPDGIVGHSLGEIGCAYCDGVLTHEQALLTSYWRGKCVEDANVPRGLMAAVGLSMEDVIARCPDGIVPACHNSDDSVTISGPYDGMIKFVEQLNSENIFARIVKTGDVGYHCYYMDSVAPFLLAKMQKFVPEMTLRSSKWISSSVPESKWNQDSAKYSSASYYVNNLTSKVLFYDAIQHVPKNAVIVEIAPHSLLQPIIKRNLGSEIIYINLMSRNNKNINLNVLFGAIGKLYNLGYNPEIAQLYQKVNYPVSRGTQSLSPLIKWDHSKSWHVTLYPEYFNPYKIYSVTIDLQNRDHEFYKDHCIDGRILFPATGYLFLVWEFLAKLKGKTYDKIAVQFENFALNRAAIFSKDSTIKFEIRLNDLTGEFCISESQSLVATGQILQLEATPLILQHLLKNNEFNCSNENLILQTKDVYKEMRIRGYDYGKSFQAIEQVSPDSKFAYIKYTNWVVFSDNMLQSCIFGQSNRALYLPIQIRSVRFDPNVFFKAIEDNKKDDEHSVLGVVTDSNINAIVAPGLEIQGLEAHLARRRQSQIPLLEKCVFASYNDLNCLHGKQLEDNIKDYIKVTTALAFKLANGLDCPKLTKIFQTTSINVNELTINEYIEPIQQEYQLANILHEMITNKENFRQILSENQQKLNNDLLSTVCESQNFLRYIIDTVVENSPTMALNMIELNSTPRVFKEKIENYIDSFGFRVNLKYNLCRLGSVDENNNTESKPKPIELPSEENSVDLVLYKDGNLFNLENNLIDYSMLLKSTNKVLKNNGFLAAIFRLKATPAEQVLNLIKENDINEDYSKEFIAYSEKCGFRLILKRTDSLSTLILLFRKISILIAEPSKQSVIEVSYTNFTWVEKLKEKLLEHENKLPGENIWLLAQETPTNGIVGLVNCLRLEPGGDRIRCIFDSPVKLNKILPPFSFENPFYSEILKNDLVFNIYRNGKFGSFRHYEIEDNESIIKIHTEHAHLNVTTRGDLSSLEWFESSHKHWPTLPKQLKTPNQNLCSVYYASLNFRDIMLASGKLPANALPKNLTLQESILGFEFAGRDESGQRVMGMVPCKGLATTVLMNDPELLLPIPDEWTMEEASTVPVVYLTAYYALIVRGRLSHGESVLIHSGSGGVGQAAISICLGMGCQVFTTVGNDEKKQYLKERFPSLTESNIFNSRDLSFEEHILQETKGEGVNVVLNSLAGDKLQASVRCLSLHGRFLEIGKYDISKNSSLGMNVFLKNIEFHGVLLDTFFEEHSANAKLYYQKKQAIKLILNGIKSGVVKPLKRTIFDIYQCEKAFRFMASGKHIGKVVIQIRSEETQKELIPSKFTVPAIPKAIFCPLKSYIVTGGLGGFGLELLYWLAERGARKLVITSRYGLRDPYQHLCIQRLQGKGIECVISDADISELKGAQQLMEEAISLGTVGGIFHLAMVLSDRLFKNQSSESFENVCSQKVFGTRNLDIVSRMKCPYLDYFVVFSSVSGGRGNAGQTNYGFANSSMERICELRKNTGFPGLAIQWGAIGDVGVLIDKLNLSNDINICGTVPQRINSCLTVLEKLLHSPETVYSSVVLGKRQNLSSNKKQNLLKKIGNIFGIKNYDDVPPNTTLAELGMDSLMAVEVKQILEKDFEVNYSMQEIRLLTIQKLLEIVGNASTNQENCQVDSDKTILNTSNKQLISIPQILLPIETFVKLNNVQEGSPVIFIPPIEGTFMLLESIAQKIEKPALGLNWTVKLKSLNSIEEVSNYYVEKIETLIQDNNYNLIGYSFGTAIAFDIALKLQSNPNATVKLMFMDASPNSMTSYVNIYTRMTEATDNDVRLTEALTHYLIQLVPLNYTKVKEQLLFLESNQLRAQKATEILTQYGAPQFKPEDISFAAETFIRKLAMIYYYRIVAKFDGDISLIRAKEMYTNFAEDYEVSKIITGKCLLEILPGDHKSFLRNNVDKIVTLINEKFL